MASMIRPRSLGPRSATPAFFGPLLNRASPPSGVLLGEGFDSGTSLDAPPVSWAFTPLQTDWGVHTAPSWASGLSARGVLDSVSSFTMSQTFGTLGNGGKIRIRMGTDGNPSGERCGSVLFFSGGLAGSGGVVGVTNVFNLLFNNAGLLILYGMVGANVTLLTGYLAATMYDIVIVIGRAGAITSASVNGAVTSNPGVMGGGPQTVDTVQFDVYNGAATPSGHTIIDGVMADYSTVAPNGAVLTSGVLDGQTLGPDIYGGILLGYRNGPSPAAVIKTERSSDGGSTWGTIGAAAIPTDSGFFVWDGRPQYGSKPVAVGKTANYRITASNASGDQVSS